MSWVLATAYKLFECTHRSGRIFKKFDEPIFCKIRYAIYLDKKVSNI